MTQGKRKDQINFSSRMAFIAFIGLTLCFIWAIGFLPEPPPPTKGIPHNYYVPTVWGHDTITKDTTTPKDYILDIDWNCGDDNHYDSIPKYNSFGDVPAGIETVIVVDGILYKMDNKKTTWTPIYADEYRMWIGNNGDTIWE